MHYPALREAKDIRLLRILAGKSDEAIATVLGTATLDAPDAPQSYDALSYVWGSTLDKKQIQCNGNVIDVTPNLYMALLHLRRETEHHVLWIDQLCINQEDTGERSQQVSMMGEIYNKAERVLVWLGSDDDETALVWDLLYEVAKLRDFEAHETYHLALAEQAFPTTAYTTRPQSTDQHAEPQAKAKTTRRLLQLPPSSAPQWEAVKRFFNRAWFSRMWTFQEVVMSHECTIYCGKYSMQWLDLSDACKAISIGSFDIFLDQVQEPVGTIQVQRLRLREGKRSSLRALLEANRSRESSEPRDMVYGLRAVIDEQVAASIEVDYQERLGDTYARAARVCIKQDMCLTVLGSVEHRRTEESSREMPSWVPDWRSRTSVEVDLSMRRLDGSKFYDASNSELPYIIDHADPRKLILRGFVVAKLTKFSEVRRWLDFGIYRMGHRRFPRKRFDIQEWKRMYSNAAKNIQFPASSLKQQQQADRITASVWERTISDSLSDDETVEMAYRRTITADLLPRPSSTRLTEKEAKEGFPAYTAWQYAGFPSPAPIEVLQEHDIYVTKVMSNREFFIAEDGPVSYMGVVMGVPTDGDCVCILLGGDTPFVLRPNENGEWHFLAEAYVHGIMDGEAMERTKHGGFQFQNFVLS